MKKEKNYSRKIILETGISAIVAIMYSIVSGLSATSMGIWLIFLFTFVLIDLVADLIGLVVSKKLEEFCKEHNLID